MKKHIDGEYLHMKKPRFKQFFTSKNFYLFCLIKIIVKNNDFGKPRAFTRQLLRDDVTRRMPLKSLIDFLKL